MHFVGYVKRVIPEKTAIADLVAGIECRLRHSASLSARRATRTTINIVAIQLAYAANVRGIRHESPFDVDTAEAGAFEDVKGHNDL